MMNDGLVYKVAISQFFLDQPCESDPQVWCREKKRLDLAEDSRTIPRRSGVILGVSRPMYSIF